MEQTRQSDVSARPTAFPWPPVLFAGAILGAWLAGRSLPISWPGLDDIPAHTVGIGLGMGGVLLHIWAVVTLKRHGTTILPNKGVDHLVTDGPFRFVRNPIYLAIVLFLLGLAEITKNLWFVLFAALFAVLVTWLAIRPEERHLEAHFGEAYRAYAAKTRRWI